MEQNHIKEISLENVNFDEVVKTYNDILLRHARFKVSDSELSGDLVQETYLKVWRHLVNGGKIDTMKTFLYQVLNNLIIDQYRKRKDTSLDGLMEEIGSAIEPSVDEHELTIAQIEGRSVFKLIDKLPDNYREIVKMRYVEDMTLDEIALVTDKNKNSISVTLNRGIEKLREIYHANQM